MLCVRVAGAWNGLVLVAFVLTDIALKARNMWNRGRDIEKIQHGKLDVQQCFL